VLRILSFIIVPMIALPEWLPDDNGDNEKPHNVQLPDLIRQEIVDVLALDDISEVQLDDLLGRDLDMWQVDVVDLTMRLSRRFNRDFSYEDLAAKFEDTPQQDALPQLFQRQQALSSLIPGAPKQSSVYNLGESVEQVLQMRVDQLIGAVTSKLRMN
jgi:acyl carrier protein